MGPLGLDIRHAYRSLARSPASTGAAVLCIALGIGATTAIYASVHAALIRPLPLPAAEEMVVVYRTTPQFDRGPFAPGTYLDLRERTESLSHLAAVSRGGSLVQDQEGTAQLSQLAVTGDFFGATGVRPIHGRLLDRSDEDADAPLAVVISEELWVDRYGRDPDILDETVRIGGEQYSVAGVLPRGFRVPQGNRIFSADLWLPIRFAPQLATLRRSNFLLLVGRLAEGRTAETANSELRSVMNGIVEEHPVLQGEQLRVLPLRPEAAASVRTPLIMLLGAVGFVLLIAAANVTALLLARGVAKRREWAVRTAIGAQNRDVLRSAVAESMLVTGAGAGFGLLVALGGIRLISAMIPGNLPQLRDVGLDPAVLAVGLVIAVVVGLLAGLAPAWQAQRTAPQRALAAGWTGPSRSHHRFLRSLVVVEVALSLVLLVGTGLVIRGFSSLVHRDPGFEPGRMLTFNVALLPENYDGTSITEAFLVPALDQIRSTTGVEQAAYLSHVPYRSWGSNFNVRYEGQPGGDPTRRPLVENRYVSPSYFETMETNLLQGRLFEPTDRLEDAPTVVVANRALVDRDFPDEDIIGKRFHTSDTTFATIVGVVENIRNMGPDNPPAPQFYWNIHQTGLGTGMSLIARTAGDPAGLSGPITEAIHEVDPDAAISGLMTMEAVIDNAVARPRFYLILLGIFAGVAMLLAMAGLYGVMSYAVAQRTREFGIRAALGSSPSHSIRRVVAGGMVLVAIGAAVGLVGAWGITGLLEGFLYGVSPLDLAAWIVAVLGLATAGFAAIVVPAWKAARIDPMEAIRIE